MGWSLSGILGAAMVGGGAAAERNFVDERKNEAAIAKAKELATFEADLRMEREQRVEEAKAARAAKLEIQNRESDATNFELAKDYAINELKAKPGTVEFYEGTADFLNRSGRKDLAKDMLAEANRIRTDDTKDQIAAARAEAARARREGGGGGGGDGKIDIGATIKDISGMTTFEDSDGKKHTGINPAQVHHLYRTLKQANPNLDDKQILGDVRAIVSDGVNLSDRSGGKMTPLQGIQNVMQGLVKKPTAGAEDTGTATQAPPVAQQTKKQKAPSVPGTFGTWQLKKQAEQGVPGAKEKYEEALRLREEAGYNDEEVGLPEWQQGQ